MASLFLRGTRRSETKLRILYEIALQTIRNLLFDWSAKIKKIIENGTPFSARKHRRAKAGILGSRISQRNPSTEKLYPGKMPASTAMRKKTLMASMHSSSRV